MTTINEEIAINRKIRKLLVLGNRGGTESEAMAALGKAQELLAKHGLSMSDISDDEQEPYIRDTTTTQIGLRPWKRYIYSGICNLYFCKYYFSGSKRHTIVGKPSNIEIAKYLIEFIIITGDKLAKSSENPQSFKKGFGTKIHNRCEEEIKNAKKTGIKDSATGNMMVVHPLYTQSELDIKKFMSELNIKITQSYTKPQRFNESQRSAYINGQSAANAVSLIANAINNENSIKMISK